MPSCKLVQDSACFRYVEEHLLGIPYPHACRPNLNQPVHHQPTRPLSILDSLQTTPLRPSTASSSTALARPLLPSQRLQSRTRVSATSRTSHPGNSQWPPAEAQWLSKPILYPLLTLQRHVTELGGITHCNHPDPGVG